MSPEKRMAAVLQSVLPDGVYPEHLPAGAGLPAILYRRIGGRWHSVVCADDDLDVSMQITIFADGMAQRERLLADVMAVFNTDEFLPQSAPVLSFDYYSKAHIAVLDYSFAA